jgi:hypothetical protein
MNEYVVAAAESLMVDYCGSVIASAASPRANPTIGEWLSALEHAESWLTPTQNLLKIPLPLAVAAVLSECATVGYDHQDQPSHRHDLFRRLQRIWFHTSRRVMSSSRRNQQPKYYEWSPTLLLKCSDDDDANEQLLQNFRAALDQRRAELLQQSEQATEELLQSETSDAIKACPNRTLRVHKTVTLLPSSDTDDDTASDSSSTSTEFCSGEAVVPLPRTVDGMNDEDRCENDDDSHHFTEWKPVRRKVDRIPSDERMPFVRPEVVEIPNNSLSVTTDGTHVDSEDSSEEGILLVEEELATERTNDRPESAPPLKRRIQQLERQLAETEQQLVDERADAHKQLQRETNQLQERLQALQLRLYISETRLQTYEEALRQHIASVADNTATSPGRRPMDAAVTPPLYARGR